MSVSYRLEARHVGCPCRRRLSLRFVLTSFRPAWPGWAGAAAWALLGSLRVLSGLCVPGGLDCASSSSTCRPTIQLDRRAGSRYWGPLGRDGLLRVESPIGRQLEIQRSGGAGGIRVIDYQRLLAMAGDGRHGREHVHDTPDLRLLDLGARDLIVGQACTSEPLYLKRNSLASSKLNAPAEFTGMDLTVPPTY